MGPFSRKFVSQGDGGSAQIGVPLFGGHRGGEGQRTFFAAYELIDMCDCSGSLDPEKS